VSASLGVLNIGVADLIARQCLDACMHSILRCLHADRGVLIAARGMWYAECSMLNDTRRWAPIALCSAHFSCARRLDRIRMAALCLQVMPSWLLVESSPCKREHLCAPLSVHSDSCMHCCLTGCEASVGFGCCVCSGIVLEISSLICEITMVGAPLNITVAN
jgi:hypothetical protein